MRNDPITYPDTIREVHPIAVVLDIPDVYRNLAFAIDHNLYSLVFEPYFLAYLLESHHQNIRLVYDS
ncbi:hypothetical protein K210_09120 [Erysipelothrix rhusiopathiae SY1027]|nr:hypothetical protein K210_09120 [Erysipelothrix rhusiopathiae SY1027]